jgi:hypothetical protein
MTVSLGAAQIAFRAPQMESESVGIKRGSKISLGSRSRRRRYDSAIRLSAFFSSWACFGATAFLEGMDFPLDVGVGIGAGMSLLARFRALLRRREIGFKVGPREPLPL